MTAQEPIFETNLDGLTRHRRGKVRDMYEGDNAHLLMIATDRISAYDLVLGSAIPDKGKRKKSVVMNWIPILFSRLVPFYNPKTAKELR